MTTRLHRRGPARRRRATGVLAALLAMTLFAAACGDDDDDGDSSAPSDTTATTAVPSETTAAPASTVAPPTGTPLKIALVVDKSSPSSGGQKSSEDVAKAWVENVNTKLGGVAGHPVELEVFDAKADAPTAVSIAEQLVGDESIVAVVMVDAGSEAASLKTYSDGGLPVIGGMGYNPLVWGNLPNLFALTTTFPNVVNMQVISAKDQGATTAGVAACAENPSCSAAAPFFEAATKKLGVGFAGVVKIAADAPNFTAECLQFIDKKTDFIQLSAAGATVLRLAADCRTQGYQGFFGASAGTVTPELYNGDDEIRLAGALNSFPWFVDDEPVANFRAVMEEYGVDEETYGSPPPTATWATLELFKKTLDANEATLSDSPTRAEVITAYGTIKDETLDGLLPNPITFEANAPAKPVNCFWVYTYEDKTFSADFEPTCPGPEFAS
jgi:branched-chain amino acid transport system substrate-binding protein